MCRRREGIDGKSLLPLLTNPAGQVREFCRCSISGASPSAQSMAVVTPEWKYIYWYYGGRLKPEGSTLRPTEELFYLHEDRLEMHNLGADPSFATPLAAARAAYDAEVAAMKGKVFQGHSYEAYPVLFDRVTLWEAKEPLLKRLKAGEGEQEGGGANSVNNRKKRKNAGERMNLKLTLLLLLCAVPLPAEGAEYFVAGSGRDSATGTSVTEPFRTIGRAAQMLQPGDTCWIREGVYRETVRLTESGQTDKPITFARYRDERVILDGADVVTGPWSQDKNGVWRAGVAVKEPIEAVFCDGQMMVEARWPNCSWEQNWEEDRKSALTSKGSQLGVIECPALASAGQDLNGGLLYLRLSKGNNCFTHSVTSHRAGAASLEYDKTGIEGRAWNEDSNAEASRKYGFESNRFFIAARGALHVAGEWWHDAERSQLLFLPPGGDPSKHEVSIKRRVTGFEGAGLSDVVLEGLEFRGCNVRFENCRRLVVRSCRFRYPSTPRIFPDGKSAIELQRNLRVTGEDNVLERLLVEWAVDGALEVEGSGNRIEDGIVHDTNLHGRHPGPGISLRGRGVTARAPVGSANIIRRRTVYNVGGVGIYALGNGPSTAEFNHVFNAGLDCVDISSLYIPVGKDMAGTTVHHNWLHDLNGIGFRVDIEGRGITFHHNLVWDASVGCKLQGFQLAAYNNTVLAGDSKSGFIVVFEPEATPEECGMACAE